MLMSVDGPVSHCQVDEAQLHPLGTVPSIKA
jgi:hypothetical protein